MGTPHTHSLKERSLMASSSQATNLQWPKIVIFLSCGYFPNLALALKSNLQLINKFHISKFNNKRSFGQSTPGAWEHPHLNYGHNPLTWSGSGSEIQDHSDYGASKELLDPYSGFGFSNSFDELWSELSLITDPDLDHPKKCTLRLCHLFSHQSERKQYWQGYVAECWTPNAVFA